MKNNKNFNKYSPGKFLRQQKKLRKYDPNN